MKQVFKAVCAA